MQVIEQTHEQKMAMYMKLPKKKLIEMLIQCNLLLEARSQAGEYFVQPVVSGQFCGTCETELQLWNVKFKQWYCPQCRTYLPQHFR